ncbi:MAG: S41 family peptidase [Planctomycetota bacterium]|nr:S41 family peptidase [Planctomycetota bacterium]
MTNRIPIIALALLLTSCLTAETTTKPIVTQVSYDEAFADLYETLGREYPCFDLKQIDWKAVGKEMLPQSKQVKTDEQFGLLCMKLIARLEDSHALLRQGRIKPPSPLLPRWDPGLACMIDDHGKPVVYYIDKDGPAEKAGVKIGMTILSVNGKPAEQAIKDFMSRQSMYWGYSSQRYLKYHAARFFIRQMKKGDAVTLEMQEPNGRIHTFKLPSTLGGRYLRRLPVPIKGISDSANVSWTMLDNDIGYIYVRRIRKNLIESLDRAVEELKDARGLIIDVRGNSGGGFDARRAYRNFALNDNEEPKRPRFKKPMALLINARCISAGEGWASWFIARKRAKVFGSATAGASSRKRTYTLKNGLYKVTFPVKAYRGFLDRLIERRGLEPDVKVRQSAQDLAAGRDTVLEAARKYLLSAVSSAPAVDPAVMAILKRLESAGDKYPNITAKIDLKVDMLQIGDTENKTGKVYYQGPGEKEPAKFRIHFDTLRQGTGPKIKDVVDYAFDGEWLTERKERIKQMSRYQVAPPGGNVNLLQLGKGPFLVPFGQNAQTVIKHFQPSSRPAKKTDPKNTDYIKLTTRRQYRKEFSVVWLEMWVDRKTSLPVKIVAEDRSENITTVLFKDIKTPKSFPKKTFDLPRPPSNWEYLIRPYQGAGKP